MTVRSAGGARGAGCGLFLPRTKFTHRLQKLQTPSKRMTFLPLGREKDGGSLPLSGPVADVGSLSASALLMPSSTLPAVDIDSVRLGARRPPKRRQRGRPADDFLCRTLTLTLTNPPRPHGNTYLPRDCNPGPSGHHASPLVPSA